MAPHSFGKGSPLGLPYIGCGPRNRSLFRETLMYQLLRYGVALSVALLSLAAHADLQQQLDSLEPGSSFELPPETLSPLAIRVPGVTVSCAPETVIDGQGQGNTVDILAEGVTFSGCTVRNWVMDLNELYAGCFVAREASGSVVEDNRLQGPAFG